MLSVNTERDPVTGFASSDVIVRGLDGAVRSGRGALRDPHRADTRHARLVAEIRAASGYRFVRLCDKGAGELRAINLDPEEISRVIDELARVRRELRTGGRR